MVLSGFEFSYERTASWLYVRVGEYYLRPLDILVGSHLNVATSNESLSNEAMEVPTKSATTVVVSMVQILVEWHESVDFSSCCT